MQIEATLTALGLDPQQATEKYCFIYSFFFSSDANVEVCSKIQSE